MSLACERLDHSRARAGAERDKIAQMERGFGSVAPMNDLKRLSRVTSGSSVSTQPSPNSAALSAGESLTTDEIGLIKQP